MSDFLTAKQAAELRHARNEVRHYKRRLEEHPEKAAIIQARYERAIALLATFRLSGQQVNHDKASLPKPVNTD